MSSLNHEFCTAKLLLALVYLGFLGSAVPGTHGVFHTHLEWVNEWRKTVFRSHPGVLGTARMKHIPPRVHPCGHHRAG